MGASSLKNAPPYMLLPKLLSSEIIVMYRFRIYPEVIKHLVDGGTHRAGSAHIVLDILRIGMVLEICLIDHLMHESGGVLYTCGISRRVGTVEGEMEFEVGIFLFELQEVL